MFAGIGCLFAGPVATDEIEVFAEVGEVFFCDRVGATIPALMSQARLIAHAIEADFEIRPALVTSFRAPGQSRERVFPTTIVTMPRHKLLV